ncbi:DUF1289 domain-containing protein [Prosthecomicrobium sp. N25]|uniref:DUF1289 domain-containing protein n=1 Tax=Prosthecomicrobium sp. N25 TaxID=3129254 RepID=UPI003077BD75
MPSSRPILTPCVKICRVDPAGRTCVGCERTLEEIGGWAGYAEAERARIMAELPGRRRRREAAMAAQQQQ